MSIDKIAVAALAVVALFGTAATVNAENHLGQGAAAKAAPPVSAPRSVAPAQSSRAAPSNRSNVTRAAVGTRVGAVSPDSRRVHGNYSGNTGGRYRRDGGSLVSGFGAGAAVGYGSSSYGYDYGNSYYGYDNGYADNYGYDTNAYGYGAATSAYGAYGSDGDECMIQRRVVFDSRGRRHVRRVQVCD